MSRADAAESKVSDLEREADALDGKSLFTYLEPVSHLPVLSNSSIFVTLRKSFTFSRLCRWTDAESQFSASLFIFSHYATNFHYDGEPNTSTLLI